MTWPITTTKHTIAVDDRDRRYLLTVADQTAAAPLVLVLHGSNQTPATIRAFTEPGFDTFASVDGAVVAYPEGFKKHWNDARRSAGFAARTEGYDDVAFIQTLVAHLVGSYGIASARVYAVGFSNGGQLVTRLAHEAPELFAGVALIGATQPAAENFAPSSDQRLGLPVLIVHGTRDPIVPYQGGLASLFGFRPRGLGLSAPATAQYWADRNGITTAPSVAVVAGRDSDRTRIERTDYHAEARPPVRLYTVHGGGHVVPGDKKAPRIMGRTSRQLRTVDEIALFFGLRTARTPP